MKVDNELMEKVNVLLAEELAAIESYILHSEMCENCGYTLMGNVIKEHAIKEMDHTQKLIKHILDIDSDSPSENVFPFLKNIKVEQHFEFFCAVEAGP
jgi:bacterioferritin (cytochrome b1)